MAESLAVNGVSLPVKGGRKASRPRQIGLLRGVLRFFRELAEAAAQAGRSLLAHQLRTGLTILGIAIGVGTVISIDSMVAGFDESVSKSLSMLGPNTLYVSKFNWGVNSGNFFKFRNRPVVGKGDWKALEAGMTLAEAIAPMTGTQATVNYSGAERELKNVEIRGTVESFLDTGGWSIKRGRFLSAMDEELGTDVCVIGQDIEDAFFKTRDPIGQQLRVGPAARCTIVGTLMRKGNAFGRSQDGVVILPLSSFGRGFGSKRGVTIAVIAKEGRLSDAEEEVIAVLRKARRLQPETEDNFSVNRQDRIRQGIDQTTLAMKVVGLVIGVITLIVGGIGIMTILLVSVKERTREIGVRRALGARKLTILLQFLVESVAVSSVGGCIGTVLGIFVAWFVAQVSPMPAAASAGVIAVGAAFSVGTGLLFGIWPAWSAASLHPIEALRHE
jgi:putative ABC transport system permease protein